MSIWLSNIIELSSFQILLHRIFFHASTMMITIWHHYSKRGKEGQKRQAFWTQQMFTFVYFTYLARFSSLALPTVKIGVAKTKFQIIFFSVLEQEIQMGVVHLLRYWVVIQGDPTSFVWFNEQKSWKWKLIKNSWKYKGFEDFRKLHYNLMEKKLKLNKNCIDNINDLHLKSLWHLWNNFPQ